jgi:hypothetical protein
MRDLKTVTLEALVFIIGRRRARVNLRASMTDGLFYISWRSSHIFLNEN